MARRVATSVDGCITSSLIALEPRSRRSPHWTSRRSCFPLCADVRSLSSYVTRLQADILGQFKKTTWSRKAERHSVRQSLGDFDRFKLMLLRQKKANLVNKEFGKLRRAANPQKGATKKAAKPAAKAAKK